MTVLPTVRHQLYRAAEAQAGGRATTGGHRRRRVTAGAVVPLGLGVALAVAVLAFVLLSRTPTRAPAPASAGSVVREVLHGDGIGTIRFGRSATAAITGIERELRLGRPATAATASSTGYQRFGCGFIRRSGSGCRSGRPASLTRSD